MECEATGLS